MSELIVEAVLPAVRKRSAFLAFNIRLIREKPLGAVGGVVFLLFMFCGIFANFLAPFEMNHTDLTQRLQAPSLAFPFGTDHLGRDVLSRVLIGAQISMIVSFLAAGLATVISIVIGVLSGYFCCGRCHLRVLRW